MRSTRLCPTLVLRLPLLLLLLFPLQIQCHAGSGGGNECAARTSYECPYLTDVCNETVYVHDCLKCHGYLSIAQHEKICFDRKVLNGNDNPNVGYLWRDVIGMFVWFVVSGVATACGVGGGGIFVSLGILLLNFAPKPSSGLSQSSIFGASLGGLLLNLREKHPFATKVTQSDWECVAAKDLTDHEKSKYYTRPVIDFDMALFLAPMLLAGAVLGVLIQKVSPNWLYMTFAVVVLGFTALKTFKKYKNAHEKETAAKTSSEPKENTPLIASPKPESMLLQSSVFNGYDNGNVVTASQSLVHDPNDILEAEKLDRIHFWLAQDARQYPLEKLLSLFVLWVGLAFLTFLKGGEGAKSIIGITCASSLYGVLTALQFLWTMGFSAIFAYRLIKHTADKVACDYPLHPHDVVWDFHVVSHYGFLAFVAGVVAGLIGIGGGMVLGPLMLQMGVQPSVASATNTILVTLASSTVALLFITSGLVPWQYAAIFFVVSFAGANVGKTKIDEYVKKSGRASFLILLLAVIVGLSTIGCLVVVFLSLADADWCLEGFHQFCNLSELDSEGDLCPIDRMLLGIPISH